MPEAIKDTLSSNFESQLLKQLEHQTKDDIFCFVTAYIVQEYNRLTHPSLSNSEIHYRLKQKGDNKRIMEQKIKDKNSWKTDNLEEMDTLHESKTNPLAILSRFIVQESTRPLLSLPEDKKSKYEKRMAGLLEGATEVITQSLVGSGYHFGQEGSESFFIPRISNFPEGQLFDIDKGGINLDGIDNRQTAINRLRAHLFPAIQAEQAKNSTAAQSLSALAKGLRKTPEILIKIGETALFLAEQVQEISDIVTDSLETERIKPDCFDACLFVISALACPHDLVSQQIPNLSYRNFTDPQDSYPNRVVRRELEQNPTLKLWQTTRTFLVYSLIRELEKTKTKNPELSRKLSRYLFPEKERRVLLEKRNSLKQQEEKLVQQLTRLREEIQEVNDTLHG